MLPALVVAAEVHAVGTQRQRSVHVVVDDEGRAVRGGQVAERLAALDDLRGGAALEPQLQNGGAALERELRRLEIIDERVQPHSPVRRARESRVAGSSAASES